MKRELLIRSRKFYGNKTGWVVNSDGVCCLEVRPFKGLAAGARRASSSNEKASGLKVRLGGRESCLNVIALARESLLKSGNNRNGYRGCWLQGGR